MRLAQKILLVFIILSAFLFIVKPTFAQIQNTNNNSNFSYPETNPDVPKNLHTYSQSIIIELLSAISCQLTGIDPATPNNKCLGVNPKTGEIGFVQNGGGAIGVMGNLIGATYNIPITSRDYIAYMGNNFGFTKAAYAQSPAGRGFDSLSPVRNLWVAFRNIVYLLFALVFVIIGLAIMFRIKIDPRTVMTIQNSIPKIIIALLLVTFSYAIAGFLIDMMWLLIFLLFNILGGIPSVPGNMISEKTQALYSTPFGFMGIDNFLAIAWNTSGSFGALIGQFIISFLQSNTGRWLDLLNPINATNPAIWGFKALCFVSNNFPGCEGLQAVQAGPIMGLGSVIAFIIVSIAMLWALLRLWFALIMAYIFLLLDVVFAPFILMTGALPGGKGFGTWMRDIVANMMAFPVAVTIFLLGFVFQDAFSKNTADSFVPPLIGGLGGPSNIDALIGFGIILLAPEAVHMARDYLKAPEFKYASAISQGVGTGAGFLVNMGKNTVGTWREAKEPQVKVDAATGTLKYSEDRRKGAIGAILKRFSK